MQKISDIINRNFMKINILDGVSRVQNTFHTNSIECFAVYENEKIVGVITTKELVGAHPNRIVADVMTSGYECMDSTVSIWKIKEIFDYNNKTNVIFIEEKNEIIGFVTRTTLTIELGKHVDLLTGLYKNNYIFYNARKLVKNRSELSVIFIDLNNFGHIDKKYGHINGDAILKSVAEILSQNISPDTYLCRFGGDEFVVLTPWHIDKSKALAEKLINEIDTFEFPNAIPVSASIGIAGSKILSNNIDNIIDLINKTINLASLSSTRAKKSSESSIDIAEIA